MLWNNIEHSMLYERLSLKFIERNCPIKWYKFVSQKMNLIYFLTTVWMDGIPDSTI
jgi:hypothetical protein